MKAVWRKWQPVLWLVVTALVLYWAVSGLETRTVPLSESIPQTAKIFSVMFGHTDWANTPDTAQKLLETVQMGFLGTIIAAFLAVPFGFLAATNTGRKASGVGKFLLNAIRTFPEVILAIVFIKGIGPGPFAGIMTMGIHSIGMLGKLYSEAVESIDKGPGEALMSTGANRIQQVWYAVVPQVMPEFVSYAIYRFEINARSAAILGVVGAGGIGTSLIFAILQRDWGRVGIILLGIIILVTAIDLLSGWLRKKLV